MATTPFIARNGLVTGAMTIDGTTGVATLGNTVVSASRVTVGNATVNTTITQGVITTGAPSINATHIIVGANCIVNTTVISANNIALTSNATIGRLVYTLTNGYNNITAAGANSGVIIQVSGSTNSVFVDATGKVGVGTVPSDNFHVQGNMVASGDITTSFSDERLKDHVYDLTGVLEKLKTIKGFAYVPSATCLKYDPNQSADIKFGVSAQKVQEVFPELVSRAPFDRTPEGTSKTGKDFLTVDYVRLVPVLIQAINELQDKYDKQQKTIEQLLYPRS